MALRRVVKPGPEWHKFQPLGSPSEHPLFCIITDDNTLFILLIIQAEQLDSKFSLLKQEKDLRNQPFMGREDGFGSECSESEGLTVSPNEVLRQVSSGFLACP